VRFIRSPVFVSAGVNDPRSPIRQIQDFVSRLAELGLPHELHRRNSGHASAVAEERIDLFRRELAFVSNHLAGLR